MPDMALPIRYQQVIGIVGKTLEVFDDDKLIPAFGFGDATTADKGCFPFLPDRMCNTFREVFLLLRMQIRIRILRIECTEH